MLWKGCRPGCNIRFCERWRSAAAGRSGRFLRGVNDARSCIHVLCILEYDPWIRFGNSTSLQIDDASPEMHLVSAFQILFILNHFLEARSNAWAWTCAPLRTVWVPSGASSYGKESAQMGDGACRSSIPLGGEENSPLPFSGPVLAVPAQPSPASQPRTGTETAKRVRASSWTVDTCWARIAHSIAQATRLFQSPPLDILSPHSLLRSALLCSALPVSLRSDTRLDVCASPSYHIRSGIVALPTASLTLIFFY
jgi:hypothetical protein